MTLGNMSIGGQVTVYPQDHESHGYLSVLPAKFSCVIHPLLKRQEKIRIIDTDYPTRIEAARGLKPFCAPSFQNGFQANRLRV
jgi:hypothetical protein